MIEHVQTVAVVGSGYMGGGIAQSLADAGLPVVLADESAERARAALGRLVAEARAFEADGLFTPGAGDRVAANLSAADDVASAVADVDFVEEAVPEIPDLKREVLAAISAAARPDAIIGSNTSSIPVRSLADAVAHPERFLTVHFSNPAPFVPGVELIVGEATDPAVVTPVKEMLARAGKLSARVADVPGFVLNRLQFALAKEAAAVVEEGVATMQGVDTIVRSTFGFRLGYFGPFAVMDMAGLDVYRGVFGTFEEAFGDRMSAPALLTDAVEEGRLGIKNGRGLTGDYSEEQIAALVAYRARAYSAYQRMMAELGEPPVYPQGDRGE